MTEKKETANDGEGEEVKIKRRKSLWWSERCCPIQELLAIIKLTHKARGYTIQPLWNQLYTSGDNSRRSRKQLKTSSMTRLER